MTSLRKIRIIFIAMIAVAPATAWNGARADSNNATQPAEITLEEALASALANNQEYRISRLRVRQSRERVNAAWGQILPAIESEASLLRQGADSGAMSLSDGQYDIRVAQLKFGVNPGAFYNSLNCRTQAGALAERKIRAQVELNVIRGYFDVILAGEMVSLRKNSMQVLEENLKDVSGLYRTGSVPKFELLQAQVKLKSQEPLVSEAENNYRTALDFFNYHLGFENHARTVKKGSYRTRKPGGEEILPDLIARAMANRPEIIQVSLQKEASDRSRKANQSAYLWPYFTVGASYGFTYLLPNEVDVNLPAGVNPDFSQMTGKKEWQQTWQVRIAATYRWSSLIPVDGHNAAAREEREKTAEAEERLAQLGRLTAISIRSIHGRLATAFDTILSQEKNIETAEEGLRIAREGYRAGILKNADLLNAELTLTGARTAYIKAVYDYHVGRAELDRETGMNNDDIIFREK